jgi:hypothetical protein
LGTLLLHGTAPERTFKIFARSFGSVSRIGQGTAKANAVTKLPIDPETTESSTTRFHSCKVDADMVDMESAVSPNVSSWQQDRRPRFEGNNELFTERGK